MSITKQTLPVALRTVRRILVEQWPRIVAEASTMGSGVGQQLEAQRGQLLGALAEVETVARAGDKERAARLLSTVALAIVDTDRAVQRARGRLSWLDRQYIALGLPETMRRLDGTMQGAADAARGIGGGVVVVVALLALMKAIGSRR